jgi:hypothetical protein
MKILAIFYTQSGQLGEIVKNFIAPLENCDIDLIQYNTKKDFPFPWTDKVFYNQMPESVLEIPFELEEINYKYEKYDLIILGYQPWFLSPSIPTTSLLKNEKFKKILLDTPVITIIGARNMWLNSQESVKSMIKSGGGNLIGNVPLIDRTTNLISAITIVHWLKTGKKTRKFGFFPLPGISDRDIKGVNKPGQILNTCLIESKLDNFQQEIVKLGLITINPNILFIEERAKKIFLLWANMISKKQLKNANKTFWTQFFRFYLLFALFIISPILLIVFNVLIRPLSRVSFHKKKQYFCGTELIIK